MAVKESRLKNGTLTLGTPPDMDVSCQVTNVRVASAYSDDGSAVTVLCGETVPAPRKLDGHKLEGKLIQDFDQTAGWIAWVWAHDLETVAFEYLPNDTDAPTITGTVTIEIPPETYGGDAGTRITSDFSWGMPAKPTFTPPAGVLEAADAELEPV
jgi:hypothetical protein